MAKVGDAQPWAAQAQAQSVDQWPTLETVPAAGVALANNEIWAIVLSDDQEVEEIKRTEEQTRSSSVASSYSGHNIVGGFLFESSIACS